MRKKCQLVCAFLSVFFSFLFPYSVSADFPPSSSSAVILGCLENDQILYELNSNIQMYPSGFMKLLAAIVIAEHTAPLEQVTVSEAALRLNDSAPRMYLEIGETLPVQDCLAAMLLSDADDALRALALHIASSFEDFIALMNQKAEALGAVHTHISSLAASPSACSTTPSDLLRIAKAFWQIPCLRSILRTPQYEILPTNQTSESRFYNRTHPLTLPEEASYMPTCLGGYLNSSSKDGTFLLSYDQQKDLTLIAITVNQKTISESAQDHSRLLQYAHQSFFPVIYPIKGMLVSKIPIYQNNSKLGYADILMMQDLLYISPDASSPSDLEMRLLLPASISLPLLSQEPVGYIEYYQKQELIASIPCRASVSPPLFQIVLHRLTAPLLQITSLSAAAPPLSHTHFFDVALVMLLPILLVSYFFRRKPTLF